MSEVWSLRAAYDAVSELPAIPRRFSTPAAAETAATLVPRLKALGDSQEGALRRIPDDLTNAKVKVTAAG